MKLFQSLIITKIKSIDQSGTDHEKWRDLIVAHIRKELFRKVPSRALWVGTFIEAGLP